MRARLVLLSVSFVAAVALFGCSGSGVGAPTIEGAWARPGAVGAESAAYLTVRGLAGQADALLSASSPEAMSVELHESTEDAQGMMGMKPIDRLDILAGETVELKPGGRHLMVMGLKKELVVGGTLQLELVFENAGKVVVQAEIKQG